MREACWKNQRASGRSGRWHQRSHQPGITIRRHRLLVIELQCRTRGDLHTGWDKELNLRERLRGRHVFLLLLLVGTALFHRPAECAWMLAVKRRPSRFHKANIRSPRSEHPGPCGCLQREPVQPAEIQRATKDHHPHGSRPHYPFTCRSGTQVSIVLRPDSRCD